MEFDLIELIRRHTAQSRNDVRLGIGDDAAVLSVPDGHELVVAIDTLVDGVHFPMGTAAADIGWKALAVNLSDLAAMGATPAWALLALTLPKPESADAIRTFVMGFAEGFSRLAKSYQLALIGGDTTRGPLTISVAVHGFVPRSCALTRSGARVGDVVMVTGTLGDAAAGLHCLQHGTLAEAADTAHRFLIDRLNRPTPRAAAGVALRECATACIDISDGLLADLTHICKASGVGAEIESKWLPRSTALTDLFDETAARDFALSGGDDYELCFTVPPSKVDEILVEMAKLGCGATRIGQVIEGTGVRVRTADGNWLESVHQGWDHFRA